MLSSFRNKLSRKGSGNSPSSSSSSSTPTTAHKSGTAAPKPQAGNPPRSPASNPQPTRRPDRAGMNAFTTPTNEPPPAYTPNAPPGSAPAAAPAPAAATTEDDSAYTFLSTFDTVFLIDDSGSMAGRSWRETSQALESIAPICTRHDADGIDIRFLNTPAAPSHSNVTTAAAVHAIFAAVRPGGGTPTGVRLNAILKPYLRALEANPDTTKPINVIVVTDGVPSDDVESVLLSVAKKLDRLDAEPWQVGIQFFQVGEEAGAAEHLAGLDDELSRLGGGCRDIVDTVPFVRGAAGLSADAMLKVVLGAVNKRLDRRRNSDVGARRPPAAS